MNFLYCVFVFTSVTAVCTPVFHLFCILGNQSLEKKGNGRTGREACEIETTHGLVKALLYNYFIFPGTVPTSLRSKQDGVSQKVTK